MHIQLNISSEEHAALCNDYWERDKRGRFVHTMKDIAARHSIARWQDVAEIVRQSCTAEAVGWQCPNCRNEYNFDLQTRTDISSLRLDVKSKICEACDRKYHVEHEEQRDREDARFALFVEGDGEKAASTGANTATVHIEMGRSKHHVRFTDLTESAIRLSPATAEGFAQGEVVLKGVAVSGGIAANELNDRELWRGRERNYLVSILEDGTYLIHRVYVQEKHEKNAVVKLSFARKGYSVRRELEGDLLQTMREDFSVLPEPNDDY